MSRFDYVRYDEETASKQASFKGMFEALEEAINTLKDGRAKALCLTALEETYMWVGKSLRDEQVAKIGKSTEEPHRG
jgi:hypothetical protein